MGETLIGLIHPVWWAYCLTNSQEIKSTDLFSAYNLSKETKEFEAETVCWVVCERLNLSHQSVPYLHGYLNPDGKVPDISLDAILRAVGRIESMIKGINEPRKNLKVTLSKEADSALERTFPGFKQAIPVHFTDSKSYDYVLRIPRERGKADFLT